MLKERAPQLFGLVAEYDDPEKLIKAAQAAYDAGYREMDCYTPFPVHGLPEAIGFDDVRVPWIVFIGGVVGAFSGFALQYWVSVYAYPHNVGGRPLFSWPAFIPVTFECMILFAALGAVFGMLILNKLPQPYHPVFNAPRFDRASQDLFFLAIEARDPQYDADSTQEFLRGTGASLVSEVKADEEGDWS
jgi:hypothetical protein